MSEFTNRDHKQWQSFLRSMAEARDELGKSFSPDTIEDFETAMADLYKRWRPSIGRDMETQAKDKSTQYKRLSNGLAWVFCAGAWTLCWAALSAVVEPGSSSAGHLMNGLCAGSILGLLSMLPTVWIVNASRKEAERKRILAELMAEEQRLLSAAGLSERIVG